MTVDGVTVKEGEWITLDGSTGRVLKGAVPTIDAEVSGEFGQFMAIVDKHRRLGVRANADVPRDALKAREWRRGRRTVPHRAHVLRRGSAGPWCA